MSLDCGRKPEYPERTHADTGRTCRTCRTCKLHTEGPQAGYEPVTLLLRGTSANHCTTVQPQCKILLMQNISFCAKGRETVFGETVVSVLWRVPEELRRHLFFHCYHTKLKQLGQQVLNAHPEMGTCSIGYQNCQHHPRHPRQFQSAFGRSVR